MIAALSTLWHWLWSAKCSTAADLLALSFAINAILTGLSIAKYNLCAHVRALAVWCLDKSTGDKFLERLERLGKAHKMLAKFAYVFSKTAGFSRMVIMSDPQWLEWFKRAITSGSAIAAFVILAFEPNSRIGLLLVLPYAIIVLVHFAVALILVIVVSMLSVLLFLAMCFVDRKKKPETDIGDSITLLKEIRAALPKTSGTR